MNFKIGRLLIGFLLLSGHAVFAQADAGQDTTICNGGMVEIGGEGCDGCCYSWQPTTDLDDPKAQNPNASPTSTTTYTLTVVGPDFSFMDTDDVMVKVANVSMVEFNEVVSQAYGFDDYTPPANVVWKSVEVDGSDKVAAITTPSSDFDAVYFKSTDPGRVRVSPSRATSASERPELTGLAGGTADIQANCGSVDGNNISKMSVKAYDLKPLTVKVILVHEENDDVQELFILNGSPHEIAILAGANGVLNGFPEGDDEYAFLFTVITTGADGICQSSAAFDDVQVVGIGNGKPNEICVSAGGNDFRDTSPNTIPTGDDAIVGNDISTGLDGICQTVAKAIDVPSTGYSVATIQDYMNNVAYNQAVIQWTVVESTCATNFDLNRDGMFDDNSWGTAEMNTLISNCKDDSYTKNIFLVDNPTFRGFGVMDFSQRYGFVYVDIHTGGQTVENTTAHELGHGLGLVHPDQNGDPDPQNLMHSVNTNPLRLRHGQWDTIRQ